MRGIGVSLGSMVLTAGLLAGCASGPSPEDLARQAREREQQQERERQAKAEETKGQAQLQKNRAELESLLTNVAAAEQRGITVEQQGSTRKAFQEYVSAVQLLASRRELLPTNLDHVLQVSQRVRERLFNITRRLDPPPSVPEEAERFFLRGMAGMKSAASADDYRQVKEQFLKAIDLAPWWGDAYFNLAVVGEKAGDPAEQVIRLYRFFLQANPGSPDAGAVKAKIADLEYNQERTARLIRGWQGLYRIPQKLGTAGHEYLFQCGSGRDVPPMRLAMPLEISIESVDLGSRKATARLLRSSMKDAWAGTVDEREVVLHTASSSDNVIEITHAQDRLQLQARVRYSFVEYQKDIPCYSWGKYEGPLEKVSDAKPQ